MSRMLTTDDLLNVALKEIKRLKDKNVAMIAEFIKDLKNTKLIRYKIIEKWERRNK